VTAITTAGRRFEEDISDVEKILESQLRHCKTEFRDLMVCSAED
jgi:hypothetical protein